MDRAEILRRAIEHFGDAPLGGVVDTAMPLLMGSDELDDEMKAMLGAVNDIYLLVKNQVYHLASRFEGGLKNPGDMDGEEYRGWKQYLDFNGDERLAAHAELVKLHKPYPEDISEEELEDWTHKESKRHFVRIGDMTVNDAVDYLAFWDQKRRLNEDSRELVDRMEMAHDVAQMVGEDSPKTVGEFLDYLIRIAKEEEEGLPPRDRPQGS